MLLHLLIPCDMTIVNLFISFVNSLHANVFCCFMHDMELTLFQAFHCSSLAGVTSCRCHLECSTIGFIMLHSLGVCLAIFHCTSTPCIYTKQNIFSKKQKGFRDGLSYSTPQKFKVKEQGEIPLPSLGPIPLKIVE